MNSGHSEDKGGRHFELLFSLTTDYSEGSL